jgi:hypothetical protein
VTACGVYEGAAEMSKLLVLYGMVGRVCIGRLPTLSYGEVYSLPVMVAFVDSGTVPLFQAGVWKAAVLVGPEYELVGVDCCSMTGLRKPSVDLSSNGRDVSALKASRSPLIWSCISGVEDGRQYSNIRI